MKVVAVVQARMGSARLPGKVLQDVGGIPMIAHSLRRLKVAHRVDEIVLATTEEQRDDALVELARDEQVSFHRGPEADVLRRVRDAGEARSADVVVRLTGDCPLLDPKVVDRVVGELVDHPEACDYASNVLRRTYPKGLDAEALWVDALDRIDRLASSAESREHVTWFAYRERPDLFLLRSVEAEEDHSELDWSVDTKEDLDRVRELVGLLGTPDEAISWHDLVVRAGP